MTNMAPPLRLNVQVDRLPDLTGTPLQIQLGIRLSAAIDPAQGAAAIGDLEKTLPWKWKSSDGSKPWTPHDVLNWVVWRARRNGNTWDLPELVDLAAISIVAAPGDVDPLIPDAADPTNPGKAKPRFLSKVEAALGEMLRFTGPGALEVVNPGAEIGGQKTFALLESLTTLPAPMPAALKVWTCITLDTSKLPGYDPEDVFAAAPQFSVGTLVCRADVKSIPSGAPTSAPVPGAWVPGTLDPVDPPTSSPAPFPQQLPMDSLNLGLALQDPANAATGTFAGTAWAFIVSSLPMSVLVPNDAERLIDPSTLTIRVANENAFESGDWAHELPRHIAEAIDPALRALSVVRATIEQKVHDKENDFVEASALLPGLRQAVDRAAAEEKIAKEAYDADPGNQEKKQAWEAAKVATIAAIAARDAGENKAKAVGDVRDGFLKALREDMGQDGPDLLRRTLTALHGPVIWPRRRSSRTTASYVQSFLTALIERQPEMRDDLIALMLAHADEAIGNNPLITDALTGDRKEISTSQSGPDYTAIRAVAKAPLLALVGVQPSPDKPWATDPPTTALLEDEAGFLRVTRQHWSTVRVPRMANVERRIDGLALLWTLAEDPRTHVKGSSLGLSSLPILDISRLLPPPVGNDPAKWPTVRIPLEVTWSQGVDSSLAVTLSGANVSAAVVKFELKGTKLSTKVEAKDLETVDLKTQASQIELVLQRLPADVSGVPQLSLTVSVDGHEVGSAPIMWAEFTPGLSLKLTPDPMHPAAVAIKKKAFDNSVRDRLQDAISRISAPALRGACSLGHAGPAIPWLIQGRIPVEKAARDESREMKPLRERLPETLRKYLGKGAGEGAAFKTAFDDAFRDSSAGAVDDLNAEIAAIHGKDAERETKLQNSIKRINDSDSASVAFRAVLNEVLEAIRDAATAEALALAERLVPPPVGKLADLTATPRPVAARIAASGRVTESAPPLVFTIDQLQDFDEVVDLWKRLAGIGLLMGRTKADVRRRDFDVSAVDGWWSLSVATLHAPGTTAEGVRQPLDGSNAVTVRHNTDKTHWEIGARVDPVPYAVGEISGVRAATIRYESQSPVAEMEWAPALQQSGGGVGQDPRRPEAFFFPTNNRRFPKLPPLTFGRTMYVLPYLIGHGGALPLQLRGKPVLDPTVRVKYAPNEDPADQDKAVGRIDIADVDDPPFKDGVRALPYLRSRPVGAPRLARGGEGPGIPKGVEAPLANELPIRPAPVTLHKNIAARFFLDRSQERGVLIGPGSNRGDARLSAVRIEFGEINWTGTGTLTVAIWDEDTPGQEKRCATIAVKGPVAAKGLRIDIGESGGNVVLLDREKLFAEDEPMEKALGTPAVIDIDVMPDEWQSAYIEISSDDDGFDIEPPRVVFGAFSIQADPMSFIADSDRMLLPPEVAHQTRSIHILDGLEGGRTGVDRMGLRIRRPAVDLATYDRWVNGPLGGFGSLDKDAIKDNIAAAQQRSIELRSGREDRSIDDPAVDGIAFELVKIFPVWEVKKSLSVRNASDPNDPHSGTLNPAEAQRSEVLVGIQNGDFPLEKGTVCELRIYAAVLSSQQALAPIPVRDRMTAAATGTWRDYKQDGKTWHLGAPLTLTIEVATSAMPNFFGADLLRAMLARPPGTARDRALVRLAPRVLANAKSPGDSKGSYPFVRYVDRVALMEQRWSWRGRPQPDVPSRKFVRLGYDFPTGVHAPADQEAANFVEAAFIGRLDDDIGEVRETRLTRAHIYGRRPQIDAERAAADGPFVEIPSDKVPVLFAKDLNWRGGANLWRFALRGKSRYAAMRADASKLVTFSHRDRSTTDSHWFPVIVPDRDSARAVQRPGLSLVLPLTEPLMADGAVPPLLALFNEEMYANFNAADGVEAVIEVARHPFPVLDRVLVTDDGWNDDPPQDQTYLTQISRPAILQAWAATHDPDDKQFKLQLARSIAWGDVKRVKFVYDALTKSCDDIQKAIDAEGQQPNPDFKKIDAWKAELLRLQENRAHWKTTLDEARVQANQLGAVGAVPPKIAYGDWAALKYWQERGPDAIRTADHADGVPLALRVDGPIGYTFDVETDAGRFDHAGLLISPVTKGIPAQGISPWSMIKLRFRRFEGPELLRRVVPVDPPSRRSFATDGPHADQLIADIGVGGTNQDSEQPKLEHEVLLSRTSGQVALPGFLKRWSQVAPFETTYEGVVLDVSDLPVADNSGFNAKRELDAKVSFITRPDEKNQPNQLSPDRQYTSVSATLTAEKNNGTPTGQLTLRVEASTALGFAGAWSISLRSDVVVSVRVVVSQRPKPDDDKSYMPSGDLSVRVRLGRGDSIDVLQNEAENSWLTVFCLPLNAEGTLKPDEEVHVLLEGTVPTRQQQDGPLYSSIRPIRLSDFTPGTWCQFGAVMSRFAGMVTVKRTAGEEKLPRSVSVGDLRIVVNKTDKDNPRLKIDASRLRPDNESSVTGLELAPEGAPAQESQLEEVLLAVVTYFIHDAFDRIRERPLAIHRLKGDVQDLMAGEEAWSAVPAILLKSKTGRVRFLRVLRPKLAVDGGYEVVEKESDRFLSLFASDAQDDKDAIDRSPLDAGGIVLGLSIPIEWDAR
ncbi:hypothetical protein IVB08_10035 [Bradyrhizobium sp. 173]|uniref:hypothetical protein n=1 Tax=Bradyrhizobium sp. 173 TaxID=2782644 RepID=UPI001FF93DB5|nr:hypothetical protein [Bradyrhizobium sp. 173]MCK1564297.1 hypothetical protein [Bradyrhizobium sp. 173]